MLIQIREILTKIQFIHFKKAASFINFGKFGSFSLILLERIKNFVKKLIRFLKINFFKIIANIIAVLWSIITQNFSILTTKVVSEIFKTIKFRHGTFIIDHKIPD